MIISDATAIIVLINIDCFEILETFKTPIIVTSEVYNEVASHAYGKKIVDEKIKNPTLCSNLTKKLLLSPQSMA